MVRVVPWFNRGLTYLDHILTIKPAHVQPKSEGSPRSGNGLTISLEVLF
jgi:hypothetical protein